MEEKQVRVVNLELLEALPDLLDAGAPFSVTVAVSTTNSGDLAGALYQIMGDELLLQEGVLPAVVRIDPASDAFDPRNGPVDMRDRVTLSLIAPEQIGSFRWRLLIPDQDIGAITYAQSAMEFSFQTREHQTSLAVWDVPSPVETNGRFAFKLGAKCTACCSLDGRRVELHDATGRLVAHGRIGSSIWEGAEGLFWTEMSGVASATEGLATFTASLPADEPGAAHAGASTSLSFMTVGEGRHSVALVVVETGSAIPIPDVHVRLGFHRSVTDEDGAVKFCVSSGDHRLVLSKAGYAAPERMLSINDDLDLIVEAEALPPKDPYARWQT